MATLKKDEILGADDIKTEKVYVAEWNGEVNVRGLTGKQRDQYESAMVEIRGKRTQVDMTHARARLVSMSVVDDDGNLVFTAADIPALSEKGAAPLNTVSDVARRLSGLNDDDMEELVGNFTKAPNGDSGSASPSPSETP